MRFRNAYHGISTVFKAEILSLAGTILLAVAAVFAVIGNSGEAAKSGETATVIGGAAGLAALTIFVIALFMQLSGLKRAAKDENAFRTAWLFAIGMLAVDVLGGLITARGGSSLVSDTSHIFSVFVFIFTVTGISNLANRMNRPDMGALGLKVLVLQVAMSLVSFILSLFTGSSAGPVLSFVSVALDMIMYIVYLVYLSRAKKMLA